VKKGETIRSPLRLRFCLSSPENSAIRPATAVSARAPGRDPPDMPAASSLGSPVRPSLVIEPTHALVAQLDRASDFESEGREFESLRARQH
jgi:hypothetical protein